MKNLRYVLIPWVYTWLAGPLLAQAPGASENSAIIPAPPPTPVSVTPPAGSGMTQTFTFNFQAGSALVNILINSVLDGRQACYLAFEPLYTSPGVPGVVAPTSGSLFLVDNAGDAAGPFAGMVLPGASTISNSQCSISGMGSFVSVSSSGNTLSLTLAITFLAPEFSGNKVIYMAAANANGGSGWYAMGTWTVPGASSSGPTVNGMTPGRSTGYSQSYTFTFTDPIGWPDIAVTNVLINSAINGIGACYVAVVLGSAGSAAILLVDDAGDSGGPFSALELPGPGMVSNSQCTIWGQGSSVSASGTTLTLNLAITFKPSFAGNQVVYAAVRNSNQNSGWQAVGTAWVTGSDPIAPTITQLNPASAREGSPAVTVTLTGTNF